MLLKPLKVIDDSVYRLVDTGKTLEDVKRIKKENNLRPKEVKVLKECDQGFKRKCTYEVHRKENPNLDDNRVVREVKGILLRSTISDPKVREDFLNMAYGRLEDSYLRKRYADTGDPHYVFEKVFADELMEANRESDRKAKIKGVTFLPPIYYTKKEKL